MASSTENTSNLQTGVGVKPKHHCVRYEGNNSKRWDGKEIWLEVIVLDELYESTQLTHGSQVTILWKGKGSRISYWKAVIVNPEITENIGKTIN